MSETSIRKKLSGAYKKAGKKLGDLYDVYRPLTLNDALSTANFIKTAPAAFTLSKNFLQPQNEKFKEYTVYCDINSVSVGDIFVRNTIVGSETFVVVWNRGIEDTVAIRATDLIEIHRPSWTTTGGLKTELQRIAKNVPASVIGATSTSDVSVPLVNQPSQALRWEIRIWEVDADIKNTDNIKLSNGALLLVEQVRKTELCLVLTCVEVKK